ncbi:MAG: hypothetical protein EB015_23255, partial [Methylocystaceae bacterium]|nr:hypothetical protein [Methylocystaceae bacterium]
SGGMFTALVAVAMIAISPFCGGTSLALMGAFMLVMQESGGQDALNSLIVKAADATGGGLGFQIFLEVVVAVVEAVALSGVAGLTDSLLAKLATTGEEVGANLAAETATQTAVSASQELEMVEIVARVSEPASESAESAASGSESAATAVSSGAAAGSIDSSISASNSTNSTIQDLLKDAARRAFGETKGAILLSVIGKAMMQAGTTSLWSDLIRGIIEIAKKAGSNVSDADEDEACAIGGAVLGAVAAMCGAFMDAGAGSADLAKALSEKIGEKAFDGLKSAIGAMTSMLTLQQSAYLIQLGMSWMMFIKLRVISFSS